MRVEPVPIAAPAPAADLLAGAARPVRVAAVTRLAAYLATGDPAVPVLCLGTADAVRLPCSLVLPALVIQGPLMSLEQHEGTLDHGWGVFAGWRVGQPGLAGDGGVRVGEHRWRVARWWRPAGPRPLDAPPGRLRDAGDALAAQVPDPLDAGGRAAVQRLVTTLRGDTDPAAAVRGLLGRGPGLTPLGDDVLAGAMLTLRALGSPAAAPLATEVGAAVGTPVGAAGARTTLVSAALLAHAARGECVAALAGLLDAVGRGRGPDLGRAAARVVEIGHSSGAGLVHGVVAGLAVHR